MKEQLISFETAKLAKEIKEDIIKLLLKFEPIHYSRLYEFLSYDSRVIPFQALAQYVDGAITLKNKYYPNMIYEKLCNNDIKAWNINGKILLETLNLIK